jgi:hypothetical protein
MGSPHRAPTTTFPLGPVSCLVAILDEGATVRALYYYPYRRKPRPDGENSKFAQNFLQHLAANARAPCLLLTPRRCKLSENSLRICPGIPFQARKGPVIARCPY